MRVEKNSELEGGDGLPNCWKASLSEEGFAALEQAMRAVMHERGKFEVFPASHHTFNAFHTIKPDQVKVVIIGQDPYHGCGQANGLAFSVDAGIKVPPSLKNIYREIASDLGVVMPDHGNLRGWVKQGVLLLNSALTVRSGQPGSHQKIGWEKFTDSVIGMLSENSNSIVFMLWGRHAQSKKHLINDRSNLVLESAHPSPLAAYRGFFGNRHFSAANAHLSKYYGKGIHWDFI